jgi:hypothetical protein
LGALVTLYRCFRRPSATSPLLRRVERWLAAQRQAHSLGPASSSGAPCPRPVEITTKSQSVSLGSPTGGGCGPGTVLAAGHDCMLFVTLKVSKTNAAGLAGATLTLAVTGSGGVALGAATLLMTATGVE